MLDLFGRRFATSSSDRFLRVLNIISNSFRIEIILIWRLFLYLRDGSILFYVTLYRIGFLRIRIWIKIFIWWKFLIALIQRVVFANSGKFTGSPDASFRWRGLWLLFWTVFTSFSDRGLVRRRDERIIRISIGWTYFLDSTLNWQLHNLSGATTSSFLLRVGSGGRSLFFTWRFFRLIFVWIIIVIVRLVWFLHFVILIIRNWIN